MQDYQIAIGIVGILVLVVATMRSSTAFAWGPERETFVIEEPASYVTFNSIINNSNYGDERNFLIAKGVSEDSSSWRDVVKVEEDGDYIIRLFVHNNAAGNLNLFAAGAKVQISLPSDKTDRIEVNGYISAANANPPKIWDQVVFKSDKRKFGLAYVIGSARYFTNVNPSDGFAISDDVVSSEVLVGYDQMDGSIRGCYEYSGILTIKIRATIVEG